jgi:hypothetical protein
MEKIRLLTATRKQTKEVSNRNPFLCTSLSSPSLNSLIILIKMKSANDRDGLRLLLMCPVDGPGRGGLKLIFKKSIRDASRSTLPRPAHKQGNKEKPSFSGE